MYLNPGLQVTLFRIRFPLAHDLVIVRALELSHSVLEVGLPHVAMLHHSLLLTELALKQKDDALSGVRCGVE